MLSTCEGSLGSNPQSGSVRPSVENPSRLVVFVLFLFSFFVFCFFRFFLLEGGEGCQVNNTESLVVELSVLHLESYMLPVRLILLFKISKKSLRNVTAAKTKLFDPTQHFIPHIDFLKCVLYVCVMKCICGKLKRLVF
jgi:hypothetical protein